jgi:hypothetical protein
MNACRLGQILKDFNHSHLGSNIRYEGATGFEFLFSQSTFCSLTYSQILQHLCHWTVGRDGVIHK